MHHDNVPSKDLDFDVFQSGVISYCSPKKVEFGIPDAVITSLTATQALWVAIWAIARHKNQRTSQEVVEKDQIRKTYEAQLRGFMQHYLMANPAVSDGDLEAMQIHPHSTTHSPIGVPSTLPALSVMPDNGHRINFFFRQQPDANGVSKRGKPDGVDRCEVAYSIDVNPVSPNLCVNKVPATRSPKVFQFEQADAGKTVYFYARWVNAKGEAGPWTNVQACIIA